MWQAPKRRMAGIGQHIYTAHFIHSLEIALNHFLPEFPGSKPAVLMCRNIKIRTIPTVGKDIVRKDGFI
jgi:hypothetical protein